MGVAVSKRLLPALSAALLLAVATPAFAGSVERLDSAAALHVPVPGEETPALRHWVQLVWNPVSRRLDRIGYSAWDPLPSRGLDLEWRPDDAADLTGGAISGAGTLSFRVPGAPAYDRGAVVAQYRGTLRDGRPDGDGQYLDRAGLVYAGQWRAGLMEGSGRLLTPEGAEYVGAFRAGRADGAGVLTDAAGRVTRGQFTRGVPDATTALAAADTDLKVGIVTEHRPHNFDLGIDPMSYTSRADGETLAIFPDDPRLLAAWHGTESITLTDAEQSAFDGLAGTPNFLGIRERFAPVSLVFDLENTTTDTLSVVGGVIDVATSASNPEPALQVRATPRDPCSMGDVATPQFFVDNFGWAKAENAVLNFAAQSPDGGPVGPAMQLPIGTLAESEIATLTDALSGIGVQMDMLTGAGLHCSDVDDVRQCLAEIRQTGYFGPLADAVSLDFSAITVTLAGTLDYDWSGTDGTAHHKSSPFSVVVPIGTVASDNECGEGGEVIPVRHDPFMLHLDDSNYKIAIPFAADVAPGFTTRWRVELQAPQTSEHDFRIRLLLADGGEVLSRPIHLTYFITPDHKVKN